MVSKINKILLVFVSLSGLSGCRTSTDYPYNPNSVVYYEAEPVEERLVVIPVRPYTRFDHQNHDYYHSTPMSR